jgi:hypothetical protein
MARLAGVLLALVTVGCMTQTSRTTVHWDLRQGHAKSAVGWPAGADDVYDIDNADVTLDLPGGHTFRARGVQLHLFGAGDQILILAVTYPKTTLDDGYQQALDVSRQWLLRTDDLEQWRREVLAGRARGVKDSNERAFVVMAGSPLAAGGPTPYAKTLDSFDQKRPFLLDLEFQWL